jgi:regulation of enolase protein 1 (concanavalin A-like superfamily)
MSETFLFETFEKPTLDNRLHWYCPPRQWSIQKSSLAIEPDAKTDYWQKTHYGFAVENGPFLFLELEGDFILTTRVRFYPAHQYDQAGLMVRYSSDFWIKTAVEHEPDGLARLGAVVTDHGYSDWSTQNVSSSLRELEFQIKREGDDFLVYYREDNPPGERDTQKDWTQIRMAHLEPSEATAIQCGLYACSPIEAGFKAEFDYLKVERG